MTASAKSVCAPGGDGSRRGILRNWNVGVDSFVATPDKCLNLVESECDNMHNF
jgi:hypothetical protein